MKNIVLNAQNKNELRIIRGFFYWIYYCNDDKVLTLYYYYYYSRSRLPTTSLILVWINWLSDLWNFHFILIFIFHSKKSCSRSKLIYDLDYCVIVSCQQFIKCLIISRRFFSLLHKDLRFEWVEWSLSSEKWAENEKFCNLILTGCVLSLGKFS